MFDVNQIKINQQKHLADMKAACQLSMDFSVNSLDVLIEDIFTNFPVLDPRVSYHTMSSPIDIIVGVPCCSRPQKLRTRWGTTNKITCEAYTTAITNIITNDLSVLHPDTLYAFAVWIPFYQIPSVVEGHGCGSNRFMMHYAKKVYLDDLWSLKDIVTKAEAAYVG